MKIAAAYIRVSTEEQTELSPDSQLKLIREYAKKNDMILPDEFIYQDDGISGRTAAKRPSFNRMIGEAKKTPKPFDVILLWKFSRFARNREDSIVYKSMLRKLGIEVISISENIGDDKMSVLVEAMIEAMDEYYSINLAEEVKRGMLEKISRGQIVNAPPIGYTLKNGTYIPDENADLIRRIFNEFLSGDGYVTIARRLNDEGYKTLRGNKFENRTIEYIIRNPVYIGKLRWTPGGNGSQTHYHSDAETIIVDGTHEAIIPSDKWNEAQEKAESLKNRHIKFSHTNAVKSDFMLRGLLKCSNCGATMVNTKDGYQCHKYTHGFCDKSHYVSKSIADQTVIRALQDFSTTLDVNIEIRCNKKIEIKENINKQLEKEYNKLERVKSAYEAGVDTLEEYKTNKERIIKQIELLKAKQLSSTDYKELDMEERRKIIITRISNFEKLLNDPNSTQTTLNQALKEFVSHIVFSRKDNAFAIYYYV